MGHVHGSNQFRRLRLLKESVNRLMMNTVEEILEFWKRLINERSKLDFCGRALLHEILAGTSQILQMQEVEILLLEQTVFGEHKGSGDHEGVHLISLGVANI